MHDEREFYTLLPSFHRLHFAPVRFLAVRKVWMRRVYSKRGTAL